MGGVPAGFGAYGELDPEIYGGDGGMGVSPGFYVEPAPSIVPTRIFSGSSRWVRAIAVDGANSVLFAGGDDARVRIWDLVTGQRRRTLKGHEQPVYSLVQDRTTGMLFSGALDGAVLAHDTRTKDPVANYKTHTDAVKSLVIKKDGSKLYSASYDGSLAEWWVHRTKLEQNRR
jgi:WD40 repeat protein